jgi:transposase
MEAATMLHCGADVHSKSTHLVILDSRGKELLSAKVVTDKQSLQDAVKPYVKRKLKVVQETGALQAFIRAVFEEVGAEVVTVHAAAMKVITSSKKKTDKRDAFHLAWQSSKDNLPEPVYVPSGYELGLRALVGAQQRARKGRTQAINGVRGQLKSLGITLPPGCLARESGWVSLTRMELPETLRLIVDLGYKIWLAHTEVLDRIERELEDRTREDPLVALMQTVPYVGPACAVAVRAYLGKLDRFHGRKAVASYAGFCPSQRESGERRGLGRLTKAGPPRLRTVFVQAAHLLIASGFKRYPQWRAWFGRFIYRKMHPHKAVVALAKRLYLLAYQVGRTGMPWRSQCAGNQA